MSCAGETARRRPPRTHDPQRSSRGVYPLPPELDDVQAAMRVPVLTRGQADQRLAARFGVGSFGGVDDEPPEPLDGAILFAPAGDLVRVALRAPD